MIPTFQEVMRVTNDLSSVTALQDEEAEALYNCCKEVPRGGLVIEVGCQLGRSSSLINQMALAIGFYDIHIDPWTEQSGWMKDWMGIMYGIGGDQSHAFSVLCMRTKQAEGILSRLGPVDLAYIDGDHEKDIVTIDLELIGNQIKPGGFLTAHDYGNPGLPGVKDALDFYVTPDGWDSVGFFGNLGVWRRR
jgi:hypothetical protein